MRHRLQPGVGVAVGEVAVQEVGELGELAREVVGAVGESAAQGAGGGLVGAGGAAEAEVDPAGVQGLQQAELLGDGQRRVVGEHHAAGAEPEGAGVRAEVGEQHGGDGGGHAWHAVVLGDPEPVVAQALGAAGEFGGGGERLGGGVAGADGGEVEDRERGGGGAGRPAADRVLAGRVVGRLRCGAHAVRPPGAPAGRPGVRRSTTRRPAGLFPGVRRTRGSGGDFTPA